MQAHYIKKAVGISSVGLLVVGLIVLARYLFTSKPIDSAVWSRPPANADGPELEASQDNLRSGVSATASPSATLPLYRETQLVVTDNRGTPLANATIGLIHNHTRPTILGTTNELGRFVASNLIAIAGHLDLPQISVSSNGYVRRIIDMPTRLPDIITVELQPSAALSGVVTMPDGSRAGDGVLVVLGESTWLTTSLIDGLLNSAEPAGWFMTSTDTVGAFRVNGLRPDRQYHAWAACPGGVTPSPIPVSTRDGEAINVQLSYVWGLHIRYCDDKERPIQVATQYLMSGRDAVSVQFDGRDVRPLPRNYARLLGIDLDSGASAPADRFVVASSETPAAPLLHVKYHPPGYAKSEHSLALLPLSQSTEVVNLRATSLSSGFGHIEIKFVGVRKLCNGHTSEGFQLLLADQSGNQTRYMVTLVDTRFVLSNVPYGQYAARFIHMAGGHSHPGKAAAPLIVNVGETAAHIELDLTELGEVVLNLRDHDGSTYVGPASVTITRGVFADDRSSFSGMTDTFVFEQHPYVIHGLTAASYSLSVNSPVGVQFTGKVPAVYFDVAPGDNIGIEGQVQ